MTKRVGTFAPYVYLQCLLYWFFVKAGKQADGYEHVYVIDIYPCQRWDTYSYTQSLSTLNSVNSPTILSTNFHSLGKTLIRDEIKNHSDSVLSDSILSDAVHSDSAYYPDSV